MPTMKASPSKVLVSLGPFTNNLLPFLPIPGVDGSAGNSEASKEHGSKKRARCESSSAISSKACREKQCRDRLNVNYIRKGRICTRKWCE
ncbi:transcription factor ILR3-like isoform X2 [Raphanus sativus]|uniref:Transcription factor ILR3-like isoform X2 n=1 Tax=Raphanus sativus TaxID=3726 RepID=A0A9W3DCE3_RAPSA|nr:transcription factor ILR3-like isoform X2 [Raphanus sativus]XP_056861449.1 transcription factor ILR3-like isoform X2 [Raphanus sativus]